MAAREGGGGGGRFLWCGPRLRLSESLELSSPSLSLPESAGRRLKTLVVLLGPWESRGGRS